MNQEVFISAFLIATVTSLVATVGLVVALPRFGLLDRANDRSSHQGSVPRGGGIAILTAVVAGYVVLPGDVASATSGAICLAILAGMLGLVDDRLSLSVSVRLFAQVVMSVLAVGLSIGLDHGIGVSAVLAASWVAYVNAFNFMDGINGISAGVVIVIGTWVAATGPEQTVLLSLVLVGSALGFLVVNLTGRIFLGDVGSYALGSLVWSLCAIAWTSHDQVLQAFAPTALYALETFAALVILIRAGGRPGQAHRGHAYQRLVDSGLPHALVAGIVSAVMLLMLVAVHALPSSYLGAIVAALVGGLYIAVANRYHARRPNRTFSVGSGL